MILGAGNAQLPLIIESKRMGYFVIVCDQRDEMEGAKIADKFYKIDYTSEKDMIEIATLEKIDGITSNSEPAMVIVAKISEKLKLIGNSSNSIEIISSKEKFRKLENKIKVFSPASHACSRVEDALTVAKDMRYPIIIKPAESCGTQGTTKLTSFNNEAIRESFKKCSIFSRDKKVVLEEYVQMQSLLVVEFDVFIFNDDIIWDGCISTNRSPNAPMVPMTYIYPDVLSNIQKNIVKETIRTIFNADEIKFGEYNVEGFFTETGEFFVIEINPRQGGNYIPQMIQEHSGVNFDKLLVSLAVNDLAYYNTLNEYKRTNNFVVFHVVFSNKSGNLKEVFINPEIKRYIYWQENEILAGSHVNKCVNGFDAVAKFKLRFDTRENQLKYALNIEKYIYPIVEEA